MSTYITKRAEELKLPIVDADEPALVELTDQDVARAQTKNSRACGFVRACERQMPNVRAAFFFRSTAFLELDDKIVRYRLPESVQKEIVCFDRTGTMAPGTYQLSPSHASRSIAAYKARSAKRPGRHQPTGTSGIKRKIVRRATRGIRTMSDPSYRAGK